MRLAQVWLDDPEKQYKKVILQLQNAYNKSQISAHEFSAGKDAALACRREADAQRAKS